MLRPVLIYSLLQCTISVLIFQLADLTLPLTIAYWAVSCLTSLMFMAVYLKEVALDIFSPVTSRPSRRWSPTTSISNTRRMPC